MTDELDIFFPPVPTVMFVDQATGEVTYPDAPPAAPAPVAGPAILDLIAEYENLAAHLDIVRMDMQAAKDAVIPDEIRADLDAIDAEFSERIETGTKKLETLKKSLLEAGKAAKETVNGETYQFQYVKGSWTITDLPGLLKLAVAMPFILSCIKEGSPSARVVVRRGGK